MIIQRIATNKLKAEAERTFVSILLGARQVGKSTIMRELEARFRKEGRRVAFFDLEDPRVLPAFNQPDENIIELIRSAGDIVFIDEFQYVKNATRVFKALVDAGAGPKLYVSGSSSIEIHKHLEESLAGRKRVTVIHPLSFGGEYSTVSGSRFDDYLRTGGLPGILHESDDEGTMELLVSILQAYILKDVRSLIREENVRAFSTLLYSLAQKQGQVARAAGLAREVRLSEPTVSAHLDILAHTYISLPVGSYSKNLANELKKSHKYYLYDLGIRNAILKDFRLVDDRPDKGAIYESFVACALFRNLRPNMELRFWRTKEGQEVDFILVRDRNPFPVEVKANWDCGFVPDGMKRFLAAYPDVPGGMVFAASGNFGEILWQGRTIRTAPITEAEDMIARGIPR